MRYEQTQIGYVPICALLAPAVLFAVGAISHLSRDLLVISAIFLVTIALFCKLTIKIDGETLRWSFGVGIIRKKVKVVEGRTDSHPLVVRLGNSSDAVRVALQRLRFDAVAIALRSGRKFGLGTDDPHCLAAALERSSRVSG
jgi:hypothetical protein